MVDRQDGISKLLEMNLRQGATSVYTMAAGGNLARCFVEDLVYGRELPTVTTTTNGYGSTCPYAGVPPWYARVVARQGARAARHGRSHRLRYRRTASDAAARRRPHRPTAHPGLPQVPSEKHPTDSRPHQSDDASPCVEADVGGQIDHPMRRGSRCRRRRNRDIAVNRRILGSREEYRPVPAPPKSPPSQGPSTRSASASAAKNGKPHQLPVSPRRAGPQGGPPAPSTVPGDDLGPPRLFLRRAGRPSAICAAIHADGLIGAYGTPGSASRRAPRRLDRPAAAGMGSGGHRRRQGDSGRGAAPGTPRGRVDAVVPTGGSETRSLIARARSSRGSAGSIHTAPPNLVDSIFSTPNECTETSASGEPSLSGPPGHAVRGVLDERVRPLPSARRSASRPAAGSSTIPKVCWITRARMSPGRPPGARGRSRGRGRDLGVARRRPARGRVDRRGAGEELRHDVTRTPPPAGRSNTTAIP